MEGWIKIHRRVLDHPDYFSEKFTRMAAWFDLLLMANFSDSFLRIRGVQVKVPRGSVATSEMSLAERWQWSRGKVRRFLEELAENQQIAQQKDNVITLISIVNYDSYQEDGTTDDTAKRQQIVQQKDSKKTHHKKNKKNKKEKNNTHTLSTVKGVVGGNALLEWVETYYPELAEKARPLTLAKCEKLLSEYPFEVLTRTIAAVADDPKMAERQDVYLRVRTFLAHDHTLAKPSGRKYTWNEVLEAVNSGAVRNTASFERVANGDSVFWRLKDGR